MIWDMENGLNTSQDLCLSIPQNEFVKNLEKHDVITSFKGSIQTFIIDIIVIMMVNLFYIVYARSNMHSLSKNDSMLLWAHQDVYPHSEALRYYLIFKSILIYQNQGLVYDISLLIWALWKAKCKCIFQKVKQNVVELLKEIWLMLLHTIRGQYEAITGEHDVFRKQQHFREMWTKAKVFTSFG